MNKGVSITIDLVLVLVVMLVVLRGYGRSWLATLFTYQPTNLQLNPLAGVDLRPKIDIRLPWQQ
jgi:hypothetical protein